ncbi:hypothetical protein Hdeb2414_s0190g00828131 [Helianthus debilis subsp. tardiflorus]
MVLRCPRGILPDGLLMKENCCRFIRRGRRRRLFVCRKCYLLSLFFNPSSLF